MCAGFFTIAVAPAVTAAAATTDCGCAGAYVNPAAKAPSVAQPAGAATSPGGAYSLSVSATSLTVKNAKSGQTLLSLTGLTSDFHAGFSPNDSGFAVWNLGSTGGHVALYDLSSKTPSHVVWSNDYLTDFSVGFSPHGKYFLVSAAVTSELTDVKVVNATSGAYAYTNQVAPNTNWGFSPDDQRLVDWSGNNPGGASTSSIILYDLSAGQQVWRTDGGFGSASLAFSPHGTYFVAAAITNGSQASLVVVPAASSGGANTAVYSTSFPLYSPPGQGKDTFGSAAWGFSPDKADATFVFDAVSGSNGASLTIVSLPAGTAQTLSYPTVVSGRWQFSPCGDVLGVVIQPSQANATDVGLYSSATGESVATAQFNSLNVAFKATASNQVVTVDGTDYNLAKNAGNAGCTNGGGNGNGNGGSNGNPNTGGSGTGNGNGNGGGNIPCPGCYQPPLVLNDFEVSPIVAVGGSQAVGTLNTTAGGAVAIHSSNSSVAAAPAVVDATSGTTTFTIDTSAVTKDTVVTITATGGGVTKSARLLVEATCSTSGGASAYAITAAPINGGGGSAGGGVGDINKASAVVSADPMVAEPGATVTGTVTLSDAPKRDTTFLLSTTDASAVSIPANVTVPSGATSATFPITASATSSGEFVTIVARAASYLGVGGTVVVVPPSGLASLSLSASQVTGGTNVTGTVTLTAPDPGCQSRTVDLASTNASATVPASVTIPAGETSATFTVATSAVMSDQQATISGGLFGVTQSADLTVKAPASQSGSNDNFADALSLDLPGIAIGTTAQATMQAGEPQLTNSCLVMPGFAVSHSVWFKVTPTQTGVLTVSTANAGTSLDSVLALYSDPGAGGVSSLGTPLGCDNNADGLASADSSSGDSTLYHEEHTGPDAGTMGGLPTWSSIMHVNVTAGQTYYVQLGGIGGGPAGPYVLTAEVNPSLPLPNVLDSVSVNPASVAAGGSATGTVTLSEAAPAGGVIVALSTDNAASASVPQSVVVLEGADHADFTVQAAAGAAGSSATITASFDGRQERAGLSITGP